jgi:hypothetical protein
MPTPGIDLTTASWRKSSYSDGGAGNCVEVAHNIPTAVPVRDSKTPHGPTLLFPANGWAEFVAALKGGVFEG